MQTKKIKESSFDSLLPQVPEDYRARMEKTLAALPAENTRTFSFPRIKKKHLVVLAAVLVAMLTVGAAAAIVASRMQDIRKGGIDKLDQYSQMVQGTGAPEIVDKDDPAFTGVYVPISSDIGNSDGEGNWQPDEISVLDETVQVDPFTICLESILFNDTLDAVFYIESDHPASYKIDSASLSINGGKPIIDTSLDDLGSIEEETEFDEYNDNDKAEGGFGLVFDSEKNPLRPDTIFEFTFVLNGKTVTMTHTLTAERFAQLKQKTLNMIDNYKTLLSDIPQETIPVGAESYGYRIIEIAVKDHWLYYTVEDIPEYWKEHEEDGREDVPFGKYDSDGFRPVIDGMICEERFVSAESSALERVYLPYPDRLPEQSLVSIFGAVFRIEWTSGKVTLPKDDEEFLAWREESEALSAKYGEYDTNFVAKPNAKADTFTVTDVTFVNAYDEPGEYFGIGLVFETNEAIKDPHNGKERQPIVTIAGVQIENQTDYDLDLFDGGISKDGKHIGFQFHGAAYRTLPEEFEVTVEWNGSRTTFTLHKSDFVTADYEKMYWDYHILLGL